MGTGLRGAKGSLSGSGGKGGRLPAVARLAAGSPVEAARLAEAAFGRNALAAVDRKAMAAAVAR